MPRSCGDGPPVTLVITAVLILAPLIVVATRDGMQSGLYKESIGYRYCYSLRPVQRENDSARRIDIFFCSLVACTMLLALFALWFGNAERAEEPIACLVAATQWGMFYRRDYNTVYSLSPPDQRSTKRGACSCS